MLSEIFPDAVSTWIARILLLILAILIILLFRRALIFLITRPLQSLLERNSRTDLGEAIRDISVAPVRYLLLALMIDVGARILEVDASIMNLVLNVTRTLVIVAIVVFVFKLVDVLAFSRGRLKMFTGIQIEDALLPFVRTGLKIILIALAAVIIIQVWGYDVSGLIAGLGLGGLAFSLAAQDTVSNLFGFSTIVTDRPFIVGEFVKTKDVEGIIESVGLRSTRVRQLDQALVTVPNSMLTTTSVLNWSRLTKRRIDQIVGISYKANPDQMQTLLDQLRQTLQARPNVDAESVVVFLVNFGASTLDVLVRCYVSLSDWKEFTAEKEQILLEIMRIVDELGLEIALPSHTIYFNQPSLIPNLSEQDLTQLDGPDNSGESPALSSGDERA